MNTDVIEAVQDAKKEIRAEMDILMKHIETKQDNIYYLKGRWADEKEYEDFEEYKKIMQKYFEDSGFNFVTMTKVFKVTLQHATSGYIYQISFNWDGFTIRPRV